MDSKQRNLSVQKAARRPFLHFYPLALLSLYVVIILFVPVVFISYPRHLLQPLGAMGPQNPVDGGRARGHAHPAAPPPVGSWQSTTHALTQCRERSRLKLAIHVLVYIRILSIRHFFCFLEKGILQKE